MIKFGILLIIMCSCLWRAEDVKAQTDVLYTVLPVTDVRTSGNVWDLSDWEPSGTEFDIHKMATEKGISFFTPVKRLDFVERNDSVFIVGTETRQYRTLYTPGIPMAVGKNTLDIAGHSSFSFKGRIYQRDYLHGTGTTTGCSEIRGRLVSSGGDEIEEGRMLRKTVSYRWLISNDSIVNLAELPDSLFSITTVDEYLWSASGREFPLAYKQVREFSHRSNVVNRDSVAWILTYDPEEIVLSNERQFKAMNTGDKLANSNPEDNVGNIRAIVEGDNLTVLLSVSDRAGMPVTLTRPLKAIITDISGRLFIETEIAGDIRSSISIESLPRGDYLLQLITDEAHIEPVKFVR